jgi:ATP-dependent helicase HrpB
MNGVRRPELPIDAALPEIRAAVAAHPVVIVEAPPGAGKTTRIGPALLDLPATRDGRIVMVEPRRIAARTAAARMAAESQTDLGQLFGYQVRFDRQTSAATRLSVVTPGILLRELQGDGVLSQVSAVILDEFHERSLEVDILLGMLRRIQETIRPELRLVVMSATLNTASISGYFPAAPVIAVPGKMFPVAIRHARPGPQRRIVEAVTEQVLQAAGQDDGDMLVFLPGVGEILQTARNLERPAAREGWEILPLYGEMSPADQDRALAPHPQRKIILATNVAETSLTIDGVRIVVDSGWARVQRIDPAVGLNVLALEPISRASAEQRAGRAGRTASGVCWRLWDEATQRSRPAHTDPEILRVDLAGAVLQLIVWGEADVACFPWLTPPRPQALEQARELLEHLDAIAGTRPTPLGHQLVQLPVHPRLGRLLIAGNQLGVPRAAALAAAMLADRDVFDRRAPHGSTGGQPFTRSRGLHACDVTERVRGLQTFFATGRTDFPQGQVRVGAAWQVQRASQQLLDNLRSHGSPLQPEQPLDRQLSQALLAAMPDRVARRREPHKPRGVMVGGRGVKLDPASGVQAEELFVCVDVDASGTEATVRQASAVDRQWLDPLHCTQRDERFFHPTQGTVITRRRTYWFDLLLEETPVPTPLDEQTGEILAAAAVQYWHRVFPSDDKQLQSFLGRARWLAAAMPEADWPDLSNAGLQQQLRQWCCGWRDLESLRELPWRALIEQLLSHPQRQLLDREAPQSFTLPSGRQVLLVYEADKPPVLAARIQDFFGLRETPRIAGGRVRLLLHLLAPNNRCQQITDDLASFWQNTYPEVRKQLRGRYPKHNWPESP